MNFLNQDKLRWISEYHKYHKDIDTDKISLYCQVDQIQILFHDQACICKKAGDPPTII